MGRRQMASASLVVMVLLAVFSGLFYLIGKTAAPRPPAAEVSVPVLQIPVVEASVPPPPPAKATEADSEKPEQPPKPLSAEPVTGSVYLQIAAVEKGISAIIAEGLRAHGLDAFVAPGPSERIFRVLIGPLPNPEAYQQAKQIVDDAGLSTFARRYQQ